jgi:hypothetical protein
MTAEVIDRMNVIADTNNGYCHTVNVVTDR